MRYVIAILTLLILQLSFSHAVKAQNELYFDFSMALSTGNISGYAQTPDGGMVGTSSDQRPSFDELDIKASTQYALSLDAYHGKNRYILGINSLNLSEDSRLEQDLLSQWQTFAAGDLVQSEIKLDWYRLGYLRQIRPKNSRFSYELGGDIVMLDFGYSLNNHTNPGGVNVNRTYNKAGYRIGGAISFDLTNWASLSLSAFIPLQFDSAANITSLDLLATFKPLPINIGFFAGIAYQEIDYLDEQVYPNHILAEIDTMIKLGFSYSSRN